MLLTNIYTAVFGTLIAIGFLFRKNDKTALARKVDVAVCIAIGLIASTFFSTFPWTKTYTYTDSSVFIYIGKMMKNGYIPYRDLFDHKGIILFFIQFLGAILTPGSLTGLWVLEVINISVTAYILYKVTGLFSEDRIVKWLSLITVIIMCGMKVWEGGNFTEEYALPWISLALYIFLKYFKSFEYRFSDIIWLGVGFAVVALLRLNMIAIWIAAMPLIIIRMIYKKQWKELGNCALAFSIGLCIICIPVLLYFLCTGSLRDFIDCYFIFNFAYSDGGTNWSAVISSIASGIKLQPYVIVAAILSVWPYAKRKEYLLNIWILLCFLYFSYMSGRYYDHYGITLLPMWTVFAVCGLSNLYNVLFFNDRIKFKLKLPGNKLMTLGLILAILGAFFLQYKWANLIRESMMQTGDVAQLVEYIEQKSEKEDDVLIVGNDCKYYLLADRKTENKYFYQNSPIKVSDKVYEGFISELDRCQSDLIIVMGNKEECLAREDNRGKAYNYLENQALKGLYECEMYDSYYAYIKVQ